MVRAKLDPLYQMWAVDLEKVRRDTSKRLSEMLYTSTYNPIGTGPWPDDEDTGDPPSTQPMGAMQDRGMPGEGYVPTAAKSAEAKIPSGYRCKKCKTYNEYAESNQADGSYVCYGCR